jgi:hypothetical protein
MENGVLQKLKKFRYLTINMLTLPDKILIAGLVILTLLSFPVIKHFHREGRWVVIEADGGVVGNFSLDEDGLIPVDGKLGTTRVEIADRGVRVLDSPCPYKLCVKSGPISRSGETLICLPNRVVIRIEGGDGPSVDAVSR